MIHVMYVPHADHAACSHAGMQVDLSIFYAYADADAGIRYAWSIIETCRDCWMLNVTCHIYIYMYVYV